jgi:uncharacterized protein (TIGR03437 family)
MFRALAFLCLTPVTSFANVQLLPPLPNAAVSRAIQLDGAGNVYITGTVSKAGPQGATNVFVAKVAADGSKLVYFTELTGSHSTDLPAAIAIGPDGSAYVAGSTQSPDFPVTPGAFQTTYNPTGGSQGFLVKVDPTGTVVYASFINGNSFTQITGMALAKSGEVYLTGSGGPDYPISSGQPQQGFILKLDASLTKVLLSVYGYGGGLIALDSQSNMYVAGGEQPNIVNTPGGQSFPLPAFPTGAFQTTLNGAVCTAGGGGPSPGFQKFCTYQFVAKLDPSGKLLWGTYVTGAYGAIPAGMSVDSAGNVIVAGTTNSADYPVTPGGFQTAYTASGRPGFDNTNVTFGPPDSIGYVTKVAAGGASLVWSTYFGGSSQDQITGMAVLPSGEILVSGRTTSDDLFFADTPEGCRPTPNQVLGFAGTLAADGATAGATQLVQGAPECLYIDCVTGPAVYGLAMYQTGWPIALRADGTAIVGGANGALAKVDSSPGGRISCLIDAADNAQLTSVAPGQIIALFGAHVAPLTPFLPTGGVAQSNDNFGVFFNGAPAPILYSAAQQINVQVPFEIAGASTVQMRVVSLNVTNPFIETRTLGVAARAPSIFLSAAALLSPLPGFSVCGGAKVFGQTAVALNADGTLNDCTNPAPAGTPVTVLVNGGGSQSAPPFDPGPFTGTTVIAQQTVPGAITGIVQVQLRPGGPTLLNGASLGGVLLRDRLILVWTK